MPRNLSVFFINQPMGGGNYYAHNIINAGKMSMFFLIIFCGGNCAVEPLDGPHEAGN